MVYPRLSELVKSNDRVLITGVVPAKWDEDRPLIDAVTISVQRLGATVVGTLLQRRGVSRGSKTARGSVNWRSPLNLATFIGKGKVVELAEAVSQSQATRVLFCNILTETQQRNLQKAVGVPVVWYRPAPDDLADTP